MQLTLQVQLAPDDAQAKVLLYTIQRCNEVCNYVSGVAFKNECYHPISLHNLDMGGITLYHHVRILFPDVGSDFVIQIFRKVANAYGVIISNKRKIDKPCYFKRNSSTNYNLRLLRFLNIDHSPFNAGRLSINTIVGRMKMYFFFGDHQDKMWTSKIGEMKMIFRNNKFYLHISVEQKEPVIALPSQYIGVDLGVVNIATTSIRTIYSGSQIDNKRTQYQTHRSSLQKSDTKSSKRRLKLISKRESNFRKDINHCISKAIVAEAKGTRSGIVLEDLTHIREKITVRRKQRSRMHGWSFGQLRFFLEYKAKMSGVHVCTVDPRHTSQRCNVCGHTERKNRHGEKFRCKSCGHENHADHNAALNLAQMGYYQKAA